MVGVDIRQKVLEGTMADKAQQGRCDLANLKIGDKVQYYSKTHGHTLDADVVDVQFNEAQEIRRVDLNVKTRADISMISLHQAHHKVGDRVEYYSESHRRWMMAEVQKVHEGGVYDLDVKKRAASAKIRIPQPEGPERPESEGCEIQEALEKGVCDSEKNASANSEVSTAASLLASGLRYRDLPADMIYLGDGLEGKRKGHAARSDGHISNIGTGGLFAGDLLLENDFDPSERQLRAQLTEKIGSFSSIEAMKGFSGGLNEGVWFMHGEEELVLKLVKCQRIAYNVPTEAENLQKLYQDHPSIGMDKTIAFPVKLCGCYSSDGTKKYDLIVMRKLPGERLAEVLSRKYRAKQESKLKQIFAALGQQLADFHERYGKQHGDFQLFNIFYDEANDAIFFIDIGGMGIPCADSDVEHLHEAMGLLKNAYEGTLLHHLLEAFDQSYTQRKMQ